jgi:thioesterase domain-containing protein/acyl carrier protein
MITQTQTETPQVIENKPVRAPKAAKAPSLTDITARITNIWQEMLHVQDITPDQNYFDLGGDSILAVQMFARIEDDFGVNLPIATLFDAPTVGELARVLYEEKSASRWSPLVTIQTAGSRPPFFCMHGAGGNVLIYRELAQHLGPDQPFYGLQAQGLDGEDPPLTKIEDMAALYVKHIRKARPRGPYYLGGYCMGGTVAFEVAQQLRAAGEEVALLAVFDTLNWCKLPLPGSVGKLRHAWQRVAFHVANFARLDFQGQSKFFSEKMKTVRNRIPVWRGMLLSKFRPNATSEHSESRVLGEIWRINDRACVEYLPNSYSGTLTEFRPTKQYSMLAYDEANWDHVGLGGHNVVVLPVYPAGMLMSPFVQHLASSLRAAIDNAAQTPSKN